MADEKVIEELPDWITAYIGECAVCNDPKALMFVLEDSKGRYNYCWICRTEYRQKIQD